MLPFVPMWSNRRNSKCAVPGVSTAVLRTFPSSEPSKTGLVRRKTDALVPQKSPSSPLTSGKEANWPQRCPEPIPPRFETSGQRGDNWRPPEVPPLREIASKSTVFRVSKVSMQHAACSSLHTARTHSQQQVNIHETFILCHNFCIF